MKTQFFVLSLLTLAPLAAKAQVAVVPAQPSLADGANASVHLGDIRSNTDQPSWAKFASGSGSAAFLALGTLLPLATDGKEGGQHSLRTVDALIVSTLLTEGLKDVTHERRPDDSDFKSFPSGHASAAFTVAAMQAHFHPKQALLWYAGATAIAASRVTLRRHYTQDVVAGAAIGYLSARFELKQNRGLVLRPFIHSNPQSHVTGMSVGGTF